MAISDSGGPYTAARPPAPIDELRSRIPGWGVDLDPADRPSVPQETGPQPAPGVHWELPEQQPETSPRERSIEHARLTPVFGTSTPLKGLSGAIRRLAYDRYSEGRAAHWLLLLLGDRVDTVEEAVRSLGTGRPDLPFLATGLRAELSHHGWSSRVHHRRTDARHHLLDPLVVAGPWVAGAGAAYVAVRRVRRGLRRIG